MNKSLIAHSVNDFWGHCMTFTYHIKKKKVENQASCLILIFFCREFFIILKMSSPIFRFLGSWLWNIILTRTQRTLMPLTNLKSSTMPMRCSLTSLRETFMTSMALWVCMCRSSLGKRTSTRTSCSPAGGRRCTIPLFPTQ